MSLPRGQLTCASSAAVSSSATRRERAAIAGKSHAISRASMSSVTPGSVAPRAPASLAALRARVCESERRVGAMNTCAAASAAATAAGGSWPSTSRGSMTVITGSAPERATAACSAAPIDSRAAVDDDHDVLPALHAEALPDDGLDGPLQITHGRGR